MQFEVSSFMTEEMKLKNSSEMIEILNDFLRITELLSYFV